MRLVRDEQQSAKSSSISGTTSWLGNDCSLNTTCARPISSNVTPFNSARNRILDYRASISSVSFITMTILCIELVSTSSGINRINIGIFCLSFDKQTKSAGEF